jgi:hypothetical protein
LLEQSAHHPPDETVTRTDTWRAVQLVVTGKSAVGMFPHSSRD